MSLSFKDYAQMTQIYSVPATGQAMQKMLNMEENGKIILKDENGAEDVFYIVEETKLGGVSYILVTDTPEEEPEADAYILKDVSDPDSEEAVYEFVEDDEELEAMSDIFAQLLEDTDIE